MYYIYMYYRVRVGQHEKLFKKLPGHCSRSSSELNPSLSMQWSDRYRRSTQMCSGQAIQLPVTTQT